MHTYRLTPGPLRALGTAIVVGALVAGCSSWFPEAESISKTREQTWQTVQENMMRVVDDHRPVAVPDLPADGSGDDTYLGCGTSTVDLTRQGPPWRLRISRPLLDRADEAPTDDQLAAAVDRFDELRNQGFTVYRPKREGSDTPVNEWDRRAETADGYRITLRVTNDALTGRREATLRSTSPCVTFSDGNLRRE